MKRTKPSLRAALLILACAPAAAANVVVVTQTGFGFSPSNVTVPVGDTVHWVWSSSAHTVTEGTDGVVDWDEPIIGFLNASSTTFDCVIDAAFVQANPRANGRYDYFCEPHWPGMKGILNLPATGTASCFGDASALLPCPCGNTGSAGRGCNNSTGNGGAKLAAHGDPIQDALTLTATSLVSGATTIFLQGDTTLATPVVFGDGLRCVAGVLRRLAVKTAAGTTAFYPGVGDGTLKTRSATLGDPIAGGSARHYLAYYRDSSAAFCPPSTFNSTNSLKLDF